MSEFSPSADEIAIQEVQDDSILCNIAAGAEMTGNI